MKDWQCVCAIVHRQGWGLKKKKTTIKKKNTWRQVVPEYGWVCRKREEEEEERFKL